MKDFMEKFPSKEAVELFFASCAEADKRAAEATEYRMQNYFNCVDDYSWGGICDRAADEARSLRMNAIDKLKDQMENGKPFVKEFVVNVLADASTGEVVSERIVGTRYGSAWLIGSGDDVRFVSLARRASTYAGKGYKLMERVHTLEYYYTTRLGKNGLISVGRIINDELRDVQSDLSDYRATTVLAPEVYFAIRESNLQPS